jgi:putative copper export protein
MHHQTVTTPAFEPFLLVPELSADERQQLRQFLQSRLGGKQFWPRAFAIWGHACAASLAVTGGLMAVAAVIGFFLGLLSGGR